MISPDNSFLLWAFLLGTAGIAFWAEKNISWIQKLGGPIFCVTFAAILSNVGIVPTQASSYDSLWSFGVPIAVVLLLFDANLKRIFTESGPTLLAFALGAVGTVTGVLAGVTLLPLGENTATLSAVFSATYIGGSLNFAAVSEAIGFNDANLLTASLAADNVVGTVFLMGLIAIPSVRFITNFYGWTGHGSQPQETGDVEEKSEPAPYSSMRLAIALGVAFLIIAISNTLAGLVGYPETKLLFATVITVALASLLPQKMTSLTEAFPTGMLIMYCFFCIIGAGVDITTMIQKGLTIALFAAIILIVHISFILLVGRLFRLGLREVLVASNACILGPPTAVAMAGANGWRDLITPAILCGVFGYSIANFIALTLYASL